jgi:hypothetical protein
LRDNAQDTDIAIEMKCTSFSTSNPISISVCTAGDTMFTAIVDESGTPHLPLTDGMSSFFSVGILVAANPAQLRRQVVAARAACGDPKVRKRGYFHASDDNRHVRRFLCDRLKSVLFDFTLLMADKRAAGRSHKINTPKILHQLLLREAINTSIGRCCRSLNLLIGTHPETLKSESVVRQVLKYHEAQQILEAINFPIGKTIRTRINNVRMVNPWDEPLMDVVDYLVWAHQREELKDDEHWHIFLRAGGLRAHFGDSERFPGIVRIRTCSNWFPRDPIIEIMPFRTLYGSIGELILPRILEGLAVCLRRGQDNPFLKQSYTLGKRIFEGDRSSDTSFDFGRALFEVIDTESVPLRLCEDEFDVIKRGAAVCAWLGQERRYKPPIADWKEILETFFSHLTGQQAQIKDT